MTLYQYPSSHSTWGVETVETRPIVWHRCKHCGTVGENLICKQCGSTDMALFMPEQDNVDLIEMIETTCLGDRWRTYMDAKTGTVTRRE